MDMSVGSNPEGAGFLCVYQKQVHDLILEQRRCKPHCQPCVLCNVKVPFFSFVCVCMYAYILMHVNMRGDVHTCECENKGQAD